MKLHNKIVFITDSDCRTGSSLIRRLTEEGAQFILNSRSGGAAIASELTNIYAAGSQAFVVNIDLCSRAEADEILKEAALQLGTVDILIHNNNVVMPASIESCEEERFLQSLNVNAKSAFICTQAAGKQMADKQSGRIIYISSIHAEKPTGSSFCYSASKGAVKMLSKEAALVLGRSGINVNTIELGPVEGDNEKFRSSLSTLYNDYKYKVPNAVLGDYDDLAELVLFLSSKESRYINGSDIRLDGGFLLHYMNFKMKRP